MLRLKKTLAGFAVAAFAAGAFAGSAAAEGATIDPQTLGAALAVPYLTTTSGGERITVATVTNSLTSKAVNLHLVWISGDPGDDWSALNYDCPLTPLETTYFVFENEPGGTAKVTFECSDLGQNFPDASATNNVISRSVPGQDGIMFVAVECQIGSSECPTGALGLRTQSTNALLGDATVIDFAQGMAFSVSAIHIQGGDDNDGDRLYEFDGSDYREFPSLLAGNYIAPDDDVTLELILFTLDGKVNDGAEGVNAKVLGFAFDDDENPTSGAVEFDCFTVADLTNPPNKGFGSNIRRDVGGHLVGHLELFPSSVAATDVHENDPITGDSNGARKRMVHGWIVQTIASAGDFDDGGFPMGGATMAAKGAWARQLVQGTNPLTAIGDDVPSLNAGPPVVEEADAE